MFAAGNQGFHGNWGNSVLWSKCERGIAFESCISQVGTWSSETIHLIKLSGDKYNEEIEYKGIICPATSDILTGKNFPEPLGAFRTMFLFKKPFPGV